MYQINHFFQKKRIKYTGFHRMLDATVQINSQHTFWACRNPTCSQSIAETIVLYLIAKTAATT